MSAYGGTRTMYQARSTSDPSINKQIICRHIAAGRVCAAGATCIFAHTEAELRGPLRDLFLHCENAAPQHIERLRAEGVNCLNDLVDAAIGWSRNGHAARAPPGVVAVAIADLYGYCKQHCPGMLVRLDRTALAKGDYDRAGVKPGWVGYYVDPALQRSGREYVDADESQWAKLEATGGASLEKILELVCDEVPGRADGPRFRVRVIDGVAEAKAGGDSRPTVNEQLVERGLARVPGASKHAADDLAVAMRALQLGARAARAGVWRYGDCDFSDDEK